MASTSGSQSAALHSSTSSRHTSSRSRQSNQPSPIRLPSRSVPLERRASSSHPYSTSSGAKEDSDSERRTSSSPWDSVLEDVDIAANAASGPARKWTPPKTTQPSFPRRQSLTAQESTIFNDLFEKIFEQRTGVRRERGTGSGFRSDSANAGMGSATDPLSHVGIGVRPGVKINPMDMLYGKLMKKSKRFYDPTEAHSVVETKRLEMEKFNNDRELLDWAIKNVFNSEDPNDFPIKIPVESRATIFAKTTTPSSSSSSPTKPSLDPNALPSNKEQDEILRGIQEDLARKFSIQSTIYPHLLSTLISLFRDKFHNPHLALSIFSTAQRLSVPSYVFGCTTSVYNELIATRWVAFKDLRSVLQALEEMKTNGVGMDGQTRILVGRIRREVLANESQSAKDSKPKKEEKQQLDLGLGWSFEKDGAADVAPSSLYEEIDELHPSRHILIQMEELVAEPHHHHRDEGRAPWGALGRRVREARGEKSADSRPGWDNNDNGGGPDELELR